MCDDGLVLAKNAELEGLYKYSSLGGTYGHSNAWNAIVRNRLYFASASRFNDPFEFSPRIDAGALDFNDLTKILGDPDLPPKERERLLKSDPRNLLRQTVKALESSGDYPQESLTSNTVLHCFSEVGPLGQGTDVPALLWAHYTNGYTGLCLEFSPQIFGGNAVRVHYSRKRPKMLLKSTSEDTSLLWTKSLAWSHEKEWRVILFKNRTYAYLNHQVSAEGFVEYDPACLTGITLGLRASESDEHMIRDWAQRRSPQVPVRKAVLHQKEYRLVAE